MFQGKSPAQLEALDVQALAVLDAVDKIDTDLVHGMLGMDVAGPNPFVNQEGAIVNAVLSGERTHTEGLADRDDITVLDTHSGQIRHHGAGCRGH